MRLAAFEARHDIAVVTAILAAGIAVSREWLSATSADEGVYCFARHLFRMRVPPLLSAVSSTKLNFFLAWCLAQWLTALQAESLIRRDAGVALRLDSGQVVGTTICLHIIFCESNGFGDCCVAASVLPHSGNSFSLLVCHALSSSLRTSALTTHWKISDRLDEEMPKNVEK